MAAIQGMTHKKYGLRPELRGIQSTSTKKPTLRFKKVTKKPPTPRQNKPTKPIRRRTTPKPKSNPKPQKSSKLKLQKPTTQKPQTKGPVTKNATTVKSKSIYEKKLEEELQKIIAKAASKIYRKRHKRAVTEYKEHRVNKNTANTTEIIYGNYQETTKEFIQKNTECFKSLYFFQI